MLIAHLPAGYILGRSARLNGRVLAAVLVASVLPDIDMLWFHLVDGGRVHHHQYWPHVPAFWLLIALISLPVISAFRRPLLIPAALCFAAIGLHLLLDTFVGDIMWGWPFNDRFYRIATVSATHKHWILSFMFHWSFLIELLICACATALYFRKRAK